MALFPYSPDPGGDNHEHFRRSTQRDTVRDLGTSSISPGDGMLEVRDATGRVVGGLGDLPDNTVGIGLSRYGVMKNVNDWFYDRGQVDTGFTARDDRMGRMDTRMNGLDATDASHQQQLADRYTKGQIDSAFTSRDNRMNGLDATDASHQQQLGERYTKGQVDSAFSTRDGRITSAQNAANGAQSSANGAQSTANSAATAASNAQSTANGAQSTAVDALSRIGPILVRLARLEDRVFGGDDGI